MAPSADGFRETADSEADPLHPRNHPLTTAHLLAWDNAQETYMRRLMRETA